MLVTGNGVVVNPPAIIPLLAAKTPELGIS
jgi:hypothetical protein